MSVSGLSGSVGSNPYAALIQQQSNTASALFGGGGSDQALASTAAAYTLYEQPGLLAGLTQWDGSTLPASQRTADQSATSTVTQPTYSFDPFDQKTWDVGQSESDAGSTAPAAPPATTPATTTPAVQGYTTGTGVVVPYPTYSFNPFDQKSWDVAPPKGSTVDTSV